MVPSTNLMDTPVNASLFSQQNTIWTLLSTLPADLVVVSTYTPNIPPNITPSCTSLVTHHTRLPTPGLLIGNYDHLMFSGDFNICGDVHPNPGSPKGFMCPV